MKLLFFIHGLSGGGAERVMATIMNALVEQGHRIRVVYTEGVKKPVYELNTSIEQIYMAEAIAVTTTILNKIYRHIWKFPAIRKETKRYNPDVVISFIRSLNNDVLLALLGSGYPVYVADHTNVNRKYKWSTALLGKLLYPTAKGIMVLTKRDYELWKNKYKNVYYMPNPCDFRLISNSESREKIVLAAGRVFSWEIKGFDNLIRAWYKINSDFPNWRCQIAGTYDDCALKSLKQNVTEEEYNSVEFIGFQSNIEELMARSEVFCLSSRVEGMPMVLLEALNMGCACVAYDIETGPSEMLDDGVTGLLAKDGDVDDLAEKLRRVMSDDNLRERFRNNAPKSVERYSTENVVKMWNEMLKCYQCL